MPDPVDPGGCLRSLAAEVLLRAERGRPLFPLSLGLMAVANAFVMLGLLPDPQAGAILADVRRALEHEGFRNVWGVTGGELPVTSTMLREYPAPGPGWQTQLVHRWGRRAHRAAQRRGIAGILPGTVDFRPPEHRGLAVRLPLEHVTAVIESVSAQGELVSIQLYGHPWVHGEYWPMITPCFQVRAIDDAGNEHEGIAGGGRVSPDHEGSRGFWFWPPVDPHRKRLRVTVSTLWEAAWAEIELPR